MTALTTPKITGMSQQTQLHPTANPPEKAGDLERGAPPARPIGNRAGGIVEEETDPGQEIRLGSDPKSKTTHANGAANTSGLTPMK